MGETRSDLLAAFADVDRADSSELVGRLDAMHALDFFKQYKRQTFALMEPAPGLSFADIGCGTGDDARLLADLVGDSGRVIGFDLSEAMIAEARRRHGGHARHLSFAEAPAHQLGVADASFDAVRIDRLLVHLATPEDVLAEALRVLRPGGRVVVSEPDMASAWFARCHHQIDRIVFHGIADSVANAEATRGLFHLVEDAGFEDIRLDLRPLVLTDPAPAEKILNFEAILGRLVKDAQISPDDAIRWQTAFENRKRAQRFLGGMTFFIVAGRKPR